MQPKTILAAFALAACNAAVPDVDGTKGCPAKTHQVLVGTPLATAQWDENLPVRVIWHDTLVTLDYVPTRMNIWVGKDGVISAVGCD